MLGRGVIIPISKGEFILPSKLAPENAGSGLPSLIPPGMRAVSVRVNEVVSVAGFVGPGTRVDVLLTGTPNGSTESQTTTVLQNVAVIASGHTLERNASGEAQSTPVITLLASPEDAERLTLASSEGKIQLSLRNPLDTHQDSVDRSQCQGLVQGRHRARGSAARRRFIPLGKRRLRTHLPLHRSSVSRFIKVTRRLSSRCRNKAVKNPSSRRAVSVCAFGTLA